MQAAQASANEEGKSSAGDKYETARAMGQIERDMHAHQYEKLKQERQILDRIDLNLKPSRVMLGALVKTSAGSFWISVSLGFLMSDSEHVMAVSAASPIGVALIGKQVNDSFVFQQKTHTIQAIF
jgi:transcription elongation GreA/GreB family factor